MMRNLLGKLSRRPSGRSNRVNFPKGLTLVILTAIPNLKAIDLQTPKFVRFVLDLPSKYRNWKVQFLAAFIIDDGSVNKYISFAQKNLNVLTNIMQLCDQLGYDHTPYPPDLHGNGRAYIFRLYQTGIIHFYNDLKKIASKNPLLGLWHKQKDLESLVQSFELSKGLALNRARKVYICLINILSDYQGRTASELRHHPDLQPFLKGNYEDFLLHRLFYLRDNGYIIRDGSTRPFKWSIPSYRNPSQLLEKITKSYCKNLKNSL
jgi:hypothetical protein